jgi:hypothetical protein
LADPADARTRTVDLSTGLGALATLTAGAQALIATAAALGNELIGEIELPQP